MKMSIPRLRPPLWALLAAITFTLIGFAPGLAQGGNDEQLQQGGQLFADNCAVCHGPDGQGRVGATLAKDWPSIRPDLRVRTIIENGVPGSVMSPWSQAKGGPLTDEEIEALVVYILSWQTGGAPEISPTPTTLPRSALTALPEVSGDPNRGGVLYDQNCAMCHGLNGEGRIGATLAKDWPSIRPDLRVKGTIEKGVPGSVMPAWSQANGGPLSAEDVDDLVAFILTWSTPAYPPPFTPAPTPSIRLGGWAGSWFSWIVLILVVVLLSAVIVFYMRTRKM